MTINVAVFGMAGQSVRRGHKESRGEVAIARPEPVLLQGRMSAEATANHREDEEDLMFIVDLCP